MKKLLTALICGAMTIGAMADFKTMEFDSGDGSVKYISIENLKIIFENGMMKATSGNSILELPLEDLVSMQFSGNDASVNGIMLMETEVELFNIDGISFGTFDNLQNAGKTLPEGIYIVRTKDGSTFKIRLTK